MKSGNTGLRLGAILLMSLAIPAAVNAAVKISIEGPITAISGTRIELFNGLVKVEAAGAKIDTDDPSFKNIGDLKVGTFIDVEAEVAGDGSLHARLVEVSNEKDQVPEVGGVIGSVDMAAQTFTLGPLKIGFTSQTQYKDLSGLRAGVKIEARVVLTGGRLMAEFIEKDE
jgi:Domain of unknown function (DUF5666)